MCPSWCTRVYLCMWMLVWMTGTCHTELLFNFWFVVFIGTLFRCWWRREVSAWSASMALCCQLAWNIRVTPSWHRKFNRKVRSPVILPNVHVYYWHSVCCEHTIGPYVYRSIHMEAVVFHWRTYCMYVYVGAFVCSTSVSVQRCLMLLSTNGHNSPIHNRLELTQIRTSQWLVVVLCELYTLALRHVMARIVAPLIDVWDGSRYSNIRTVLYVAPP